MEPTTNLLAAGESRKLQPARDARPKKSNVSARKDAGETRAEEILHEIFRSQGMDLRESPRAAGLAREFLTLIKKGEC